MVASLQNMIEVNFNQRMLTQQAELRQLQAQINPHFLYNSFFILYRMAKDEDYENITDFLMYLSNFYRYITRDAQIEVPLLDEVIHADRYAKIQSLRFKKRITVEFDNLPLEYEKLKVPKLILQPLLENAFDHGLKDVEKNGKLTVSFAENSDSFTITVQDNGEGMTGVAFSELLQRMNGQHTETTGVVNIHKRLQLHFGNDYGLRVSQIESGGMCWEIVIPAHPEGSQYV
jgi:two-component system sensor histidine kinase YesM